MKQVIKYGLLGLLCYLVLLIATIPAAPVIYQIQQQAPRTFQAGGVSGTLWNGKIAQVVASGETLANIRWEVKPLSLFTGELAIKLRAGDKEEWLDSKVAVSFSGDVSIEDTQARLTFNRFRRFLPGGIDADGIFRLDLEHLALVNGKPESFKGELKWRQASLTTPLARPELGNLTLQLTGSGFGKGSKYQGTLKDDGGPLGVDIKLELNDLDKYKVKGMIEPRDNFDKPTGKLMAGFLPSDNNGKLKVNQRGSLKTLQRLM